MNRLRACSGALLVALLAACTTESYAPAGDSSSAIAAAIPAATPLAPAAVAALRDSLIRAGIEDQAGRDSLGQAAARQDTAFMRRSMAGDSARTRWLQGVIAAHGWPRRALVGDSAANAAFLIVQHSPVDAFQAAMLDTLEAEARRGGIDQREVATLSDRVHVHRGEAQRYGTQFSVKNGTLVADPIADLRALDSLRASVGLPPMAQYARMLSDMYHMPVEWPSNR